MTTLLVLLVVLIVLFWLTIMLLWWHDHTERFSPTLDKVAVRQIERIIRLTRRSYYAGGLYSRRAFAFGNKSLSKAFMRVFPKAAAAFQKRDIMIGLEHGPSSYFLHSISSPQNEEVKPRTRRKKIVA